MGLSTRPALTLVAVAILGLTVVVANIALQTIWQAEVPDELRGRVFAARMALGQGLAPLGMALGGPLVDALGPARLMARGGLLCAAAGLLGLGRPRPDGLPLRRAGAGRQGRIGLKTKKASSYQGKWPARA